MPEQVATWAAIAVANLFNATSVAVGAQLYAITYGATYIATTVALSYGISALAQDASRRDNAGQFLETMVASDAPRQLIVGERITAGSMVGRYVTGPGNNNLIEVIALADHRLDACLTFEANSIIHAENLVHGVRTVIGGYRDKDGDRLWVTWYDGRHNQTADDDLAGRTLENQPDWTNDHRGRGVSYLIIESQWDDDVMLAPVQASVRVRGGWFYDRRKDTTAGGSGTHRHKDPDTWEYTTNNDVVADHYQLGIVPYPNAAKPSGQPLYSWGIGLKTWQLPFESFKEEADLTDEQVLKKDGVTYQSRYACNAIFSGFDTHKDILLKIARAKAGRVIDRGGRLAIVGPQAKTPVMTLYDGDLVTGEQSKYSPKLSVSNLYNTFRGTFPDATSGFRPIEFPKLESDEWLEEDNGDELPEDVDIETDTDDERVQRLVWLHAQDRRRQARLNESYGPWAIEIEAGDWFERVGARFPTGKMFEAIRVDHMNTRERGLYVKIEAKEVDPDDVAWPIDQAADLSRPPPPTQEAAFAILEPPTLSVSGFTIEGGGLAVPAIGVVLTNPTDPRIRSALIEIVEDGGGPILQKTIEAGLGSATNAVTVQDGIAPDTTYIVRARYQGIVTPSEFSTEYEITTPGDYVVPMASEAAPGSPLEDALGGGSMAQILLSLTTRLDETRARLGELALVNGVRLGTVITRVDTKAANAAQAVEVVSAALDQSNQALGALIVTERNTRVSEREAQATYNQLVGASISGLENGTSGNAQALQVVSARVTNNEGRLDIQAQSITDVRSELTTTNGQVTAVGQSTTALGSRITSTEDRITAQGYRIDTVSANVGGNTASITALFEAQASSYAASSASLVLKAVAGSSEFEFRGQATDGAPSQIIIRANQIKFYGNSIFDGTVTFTQLAPQSVNQGLISQIAYTINHNNTAQFQQQDAAILQKKTYEGKVRIKAQINANVSSSSPVQITMRVLRNGVPYGLEYGYYMTGFGTWPGEWVFLGLPPGVDMWTLQVKFERSGAGVNTARIDASLFDVEEVMR